MPQAKKKKTPPKRSSSKTDTKLDKNSLTPTAERIIGQPVAKTISSTIVIGLVQVVEAVLLAAIGLGIYLTYVADENDSFYALIILVAVAMANISFNVTGTHKIAAYRSIAEQTGRVLAAWSLVFIAIVIGAFLFKVSEMMSRVWMVSWFISGSFFLIVYRLSVRKLVRHWTDVGILKRRMVIVGGGHDAKYLIKSMEQRSARDIELLGMFDDREDERSPDKVAGCPKLGTVSDLVEFARRTRVDLIVVSLPLSAESRVLQMVKKLWVLPVAIRLSAHMSKLKFKAENYSYVGDVAVFDMADRPISDWNMVLKWMFDKVVALVAIVLLTPVMIATAIAIKLESKGPVLFKQKRFGFNNELIEIYKFRSMYTDMSDANAAKLVTKDDPRVTRVGKFIRRTSIDELPQLFNVLKGEISVVGPRPHALQAKAANKLYNDAVDGYFARHKVKPGMTGWAQINGWRGETDTVEKIMQRVNHDLHYIDNWSLVLDIYIVAMTPFSLVSQKENAY